MKRPDTNASPTSETVLVMTGIPLYAANLEHTVRLFDPDTGNYSGLAFPVETIEDLMRTGRKVFMRIY